MSELPEGWTEVTIGEITLPFESRDPADDPNREVDYIDIGSIDNSLQRIATPKRMLGRDAPSRARRVVRQGDVLFSTVRTYLKNIAVVPPELGAAYTSTGIAVLRPSIATDSSFLFRWVSSSQFIQDISKAQDGTMYPAVSDRDVASARILLPPLAEQRRIVAKLDALIARTARARADLDRIPAIAARYKQAVLDAAHDGRLSDRRFSALSVADVISSLDQGWSPRCESDPAGEGQWGVIKTTAIQKVSFEDSANKRLPIHLEPRPAIEIAAGDVLITRAGPRSRVGITCFVRRSRSLLMLCDKAYRLRAKPGLMDPEFLALMLNAPRALRSIEEMKTGISDSGLNLTQGKLLSLSVPVPGLNEQKRLVAKIARAFAEIDRLVAEAAAARRLLDRLDQSILAKAFRGELVPQDPSDEPASVLLERIRAERAAAPKPRRGRRAAT